MVAPPGQPLQGLVEGHVGELPAEILPAHALPGLGLVLLEVRCPHGAPLLPGPFARSEAHEIEGARTQRRRFPVDHDDSPGRAAASQHDVLTEELPVDHGPRQRVEPVDAFGIAVEPAPDELAFPGVEIGQDLLDALDTPTVMRVVVPGEKARLRLP